jgi:hypothetical protein
MPDDQAVPQQHNKQRGALKGARNTQLRHLVGARAPSRHLEGTRPEVGGWAPPIRLKKRFLPALLGPMTALILRLQSPC